ncbi:class I SAM-dependent methyltransferase [Xanthocytophaga flava]|uniref:class I SAM-dependent methyltransferase n=1 Tax=Xanthocytophaga flava TaxID=3048013 RepID=UPI0028D58632|nr:class I SAM-dependent methyltransferase [Xanthocytophaga flavus]MDJ1473498.1 class I SAM-dependent methyltransferase [Xanthocytophaga flavus]
MSDSSLTKDRASMPSGTAPVLDRRTLENSNRNLLSLVKPGLTVLDVGCGTGAITKDIARLVGANGSVVGIDLSEELINAAKTNHTFFSNLSFQVQDIFTYESDLRFDLITTARTLQWMNRPKEALLKMKSLLVNGGCISVLDYNHTKIEWLPAPPASMQQFYEAFLLWRADAGMDNKIADNLQTIFSEIGLKNTTITNESEFYHNKESDFYDTAGIWNKVAETRGNQLVKDGYITESQRISAIQDYDKWLKNDAISMKLYLLGVTGYL